MAEESSPANLVAIPFAQIEGWREDDHVAALACLRISARRTAVKPYTTKALGIDAGELARINALALSQSFSPLGARQFFEEHFQPFRIEPATGGAGFVTGYFEPELKASPVRTPRFSYPLYARPPDLADIGEATRPQGMDPSFMFARRTDAGLSEYPDRAAIEAGFLAGKGLEIAWIESPVDGFFIHIQGSARLLMPDGAVWRISYAGKISCWPMKHARAN
jgi:membrane-bound lytic murein transglycosylase A